MKKAASYIIYDAAFYIVGRVRILRYQGIVGRE